MKALRRARSRSNTWQVRRCWQTLSLRPLGELNSANLWRRLYLDRISGRTLGCPLFQIVYLDLHCLFGFRLDLYCILGFSLDLGFGTWRRISDFCLFRWFCFTSSGKPWAKGGVLNRDWARRLTAPIGLACPHQPRLPPAVSLAPIGLGCPCRPRLPLSALPAHMARRTAQHWYSALGSGFGSRHWVFLLSLCHI
jgi:hypothetical protein